MCVGVRTAAQEVIYIYIYRHRFDDHEIYDACFVKFKIRLICGLKNKPLGCGKAWIARGMLTSHRRKTPADMVGVSGEGEERD